MKLVIDNLNDLTFMDVRRKQVDGFRAVRMQYDFELRDQAGNGGTVNGVAGDWIVQNGADLGVLDNETFHSQYSRVGGPRTKKGTAADAPGNHDAPAKGKKSKDVAAAGEVADPTEAAPA